jgi:hypothetical protein
LPSFSYAFRFFFFTVLAACLKALAVGAPEVPTFLIVSPDPEAILFFLAAMFAYSPGLAITHNPVALQTNV